MADIYRTAGAILVALAVLTLVVTLAGVAFALVVGGNLGVPEALTSAAVAAAVAVALYLAARGCAALAARNSGHPRDPGPPPDLA